MERDFLYILSKIPLSPPGSSPGQALYKRGRYERYLERIDYRLLVVDTEET